LESQIEGFRYHDYTPFVEGWAVYAESLGDEMGFYRDPYSRFGQLSTRIGSNRFRESTLHLG
jgi:uncharacterized protein (DUF885 family)